VERRTKDNEEQHALFIVAGKVVLFFTRRKMLEISPGSKIGASDGQGPYFHCKMQIPHAASTRHAVPTHHAVSDHVCATRTTTRTTYGDILGYVK